MFVFIECRGGRQASKSSSKRRTFASHLRKAPPPAKPAPAAVAAPLGTPQRVSFTRLSAPPDKNAPPPPACFSLCVDARKGAPSDFIADATAAGFCLSLEE